MLLTNFTKPNGDLTTGGIIGVVFICVFFVTIVGLTIGFFIYKGHVGKIYDVERRLTKLLNHPIENKIRRLSNIAQTNDEFADQINDVKIIYTSEIVRRLNALNFNFQKALQTKKIWSVNKTNALTINSWIIALDKIDAEIAVLSTVVDILINQELGLRDDLVDFMKQWNAIEEHFENKKDSSDNPENFIDDATIDKFNKQKNTYLKDYDDAISKGDFSVAKETFNKLNDLGKLFLKETNLYPTHMDYFNNSYPEQKEELIDKNSVNEAVRKLKKELDKKEQEIRTALKNEDYSKAIDGIDVVFDLLEGFKHNRKLDNAFETFIQSSGEELQKFFDDVQQSLKTAKQEDSEEYNNVSDTLREQVNEPINNIKKIVSKIEKETSKAKSDNETLNDQRLNFEENLTIVNRGISLLKSIKTKDERVEQDYINFLSEVLKAKSTLISIRNLLANPDNGLNDSDQLLDEKIADNYEEQLAEYDANSVKEFDSKYPSVPSKTSIIEKIKEMNKRLNSLYQQLQDSYRYYNLAMAIKILYTDIKEPEYAPIWEKLLELYYKGKYKEFVQGYIKESKEQH